MPQMLQSKLVSLVSLLVLCVVGGCLSKKAAPEAPVFEEQAAQELIVLPELLREGDLKICWQNKLPIGDGDGLKELFVVGNRIYAVSDRNYMAAVNREKGNMIFGRYVADAGFPIVGLGSCEQGLFSIIGNELTEIGAESGSVSGSRGLGFTAVCPAARNSMYFYVAGFDKRLHMLRTGDKVQVFEASTGDDSAITSVVADENRVVFSTDSGRCISMGPGAPRKQWQFDAGAGIAGPIVADGDSLFFASADTRVYRLDILTGELVWKYQTEAMLDKGPRVGQRAVYQYVQNKGLAAIDKETGKLLWQLAEGVDLLTEADRKAYVLAENGQIVVMDNKKAKRLGTVDVVGISRYVSNTADSKIYIADKDGRIACLKPAY